MKNAKVGGHSSRTTWASERSPFLELLRKRIRLSLTTPPPPGKSSSPDPPSVSEPVGRQLTLLLGSTFPLIFSPMALLLVHHSPSNRVPSRFRILSVRSHSG